MSQSQLLELFAQLTPGDRVELIHEVKVGFNSWNSTTIGTVLKTQRRRHRLHYNRNHDDHVYSDIIVLRRDNSELTTVTLDEFSQLKKLSDN